MSVDAELATASFRLMSREPFYGHVFSGMLRDVSKAAPSVGLGLAPGHMPRLRVNPAWWAAHATDTDRQIGLLKHQVLHLVLGHAFREGEFRHRALFWIAADVVVNQYLEDRYLAPDDITLATFAGLGLQPGQGVDVYYDRLHAALARSGGATGGSSAADVDFDPDDDSVEGEGDETAPAIEALRRLLSDESGPLEQHREWQAFTAQRAAERRIVEQYVTEAIQRSVRRIPRADFDRLPAALRRFIEAAISATPAVDWRRVLRLFAGASRRTFIKGTLRRPSKRYGTTPGIQVRRRHRVVVAVDTSGSMTDAMLSLVFGELHHLYRHGAEITVVECDAAVHQTWTYRGTPPTAAAGGGGTAFDPAIDWANALSHRPDALIYLTDGHAAAPASRPRMPCLWIITPYGISTGQGVWSALPGRVVRIPDAALDLSPRGPS